MRTVSETFLQNCFDTTKRQRLTLYSNGACLSNEDISADGKVKFNLACITNQQVQFGETPCNAINVSILNTDRRIAADDIVNKEFKCQVGVEVDNGEYYAPCDAICAVRAGNQDISVHSAAPYVRGNVTFESILPQLMNGWDAKMIYAYDVVYFVVQHNYEVYYAKHAKTGLFSYGEYTEPSGVEKAMLDRLLYEPDIDAMSFYDGCMEEYSYASNVEPEADWDNIKNYNWLNIKSNTWGTYSGYTTFNVLKYEAVPYGVWHFDRPRSINNAVLNLNGKDRMTAFDEDSYGFTSTTSVTSCTIRRAIYLIAAYKNIPVGDLSSLNELVDEIIINPKTYFQNKSLKDALSYLFEVGASNAIIDAEGNLSAMSNSVEAFELPYVYSFDVADYIAHTIGKALIYHQGDSYVYEQDSSVVDGETYDWSDNPYFNKSNPSGSWFSNNMHKKFGGYKNAITVSQANYAMWCDDSYVWIDDVDKAFIKSCIVSTSVKQAGSGTPSPTNKRAVSGTSSASIYQYGKNLFKRGESTSKLGVTFTVNPDGTVSLRGTATGNAIFTCFEGVFLPSGTYTMGKSGNSGIRMIIREINGSGTTLIQATTSDTTATLDGTTTYAGLIRVATGTNTDGITLYPILVKGSSIDSYEPYKTPEIITWNLGRTVYSADIDGVSGDGKEKYAYIEYTGAASENWKYSVSGTKQRVYISLPTGAKIGTNSFYSNMLSRQPSSVSYPAEYAGWINNNGSIIIGVPSTITSVNDWKTFLQSNTLQIAYELTDEVDVSVNACEFSEAPIENIFCDAGSTEVEYKYGVEYREPIFSMTVEWGGSGKMTLTNYGEEKRQMASYSSRMEAVTSVNDKNLQGLNSAQYNDKVEFDSSGLTVNSQGLRIKNANGETVFDADNNGNLRIRGKLEGATGSFSGQLIAASGDFEGVVIADEGRIGNWEIVGSNLKMNNSEGTADSVELGIVNVNSENKVSVKASGTSTSNDTLDTIIYHNGMFFRTNDANMGFIRHSAYGSLPKIQIQAGVSGNDCGLNILSTDDMTINGKNVTISATNNVYLDNPDSISDIGSASAGANAVLVAVSGGHRLYINTSLRKAKQDIKTIENASEKVDNLRGITYHSKCDADDPNVTYYGFIAEEVEEAVPELAAYQNGNLQSVQYDRVCALLVEDNKACHRRIEALEKRLTELERRLKQ